jgi:hypothetical protein
MILSPHEVAWLALHVGYWGPDDATIAVAVALAESGGDTDALSRSSTGDNVGQRDHGLFQISGRWNGDKLQLHRWRDPFDNTRMARQVYDGFVKAGKPGWSAWTVWNTNRHLDFLADALHGLAAPFEPVNPQTTGWRR